MASTTTKMSWRDRQALKHKQSADAAERRAYENTEENFPTLVATARRLADGPTDFSGKVAKMREREELEKQMEAYRKAKTARERREILASVYVVRRAPAASEEDYEEDDVATLPAPVDDDLYPPHGKRGRYGPADEDGWRLVTRKQRKQKRELTEAELAQKYREEFFGENGEEDEDDVNGDLTDRNQRRQFY